MVRQLQLANLLTCESSLRCQIPWFQVLQWMIRLPSRYMGCTTPYAYAWKLIGEVAVASQERGRPKLCRNKPRCFGASSATISDPLLVDPSSRHVTTTAYNG